MKDSLSRRDFLRGSLATAGLTLAVMVTPFGYRIDNAAQGGPGADPGQFAHLVASDGSLTCPGCIRGTR